MTSRNEITGDMIAVGARRSEKYDSGWERIFGKSKPSQECESCCGRGWVETWGPEGEGAEDCGECSGK